MVNIVMDTCGGIQMVVSLEVLYGILSGSHPILVQVSQGPVKDHARSASSWHGFHDMLGQLK